MIILSCLIGQLNASFVSSVLLLVAVILFQQSAVIVNAWTGWSQLTYNFLGNTLLVLFLTITVVTDAVTILICLELIHLIMVVTALNSKTLSRLLVYLFSSWILTIMIICTMSSTVCAVGELDVFNIMASITSSTWISSLPIFMYMLVLGKLYVLPWVLLGAIIYSGLQLDSVLLFGAMFSVQYTVLVSGIMKCTVGNSVIYCITVILVISLLVVTILLLYSDTIPGFLGASFCSTAHLMVLLSIWSDVGQEVTLIVLVLYLFLSVTILSALYLLQDSSLNALNGLVSVNVTLGSILLVLILGMMGYPPSLYLLLKTGVIYESYIYSVFFWIVVVLVTVMLGYSYMRLVLRCVASALSLLDYASFFESSGSLAVWNDWSSYYVSVSSLFITIVVFGLL